jgi:hypothetical protein
MSSPRPLQPLQRPESPAKAPCGGKARTCASNVTQRQTCQASLTNGRSFASQRHVGASVRAGATVRSLSASDPEATIHL